MRSFFTITLLLLVTGISAQKELSFSSLDSLFAYADKNSVTIKTGDKQSLLAKSTRLAALGNTVNLRCPVSASYIDNTELPVNYVPGEFFGGPAGSTRELTLGQEYVTNYSITPQIDIISPSTWSRVKSASENVKLTEVTNLVNKRTLFENISAVWFNIVSLQEQVKAAEENVKAADSLLAISQRKLEQGITREQDRNNMLINSLSAKDRVAQFQVMLEQQYNNLKVLCDIAPETMLMINPGPESSSAAPEISKSDLIERQAQLQASYLKSELRSGRTSLFAPTVSFIFNQGWQESSNKQFFDPDANKFSTQYYGLKVSVPFPLEVMKLSQSYTAKLNYQIAQLNHDHAVLQTQNNNKQLELNYSAASSTYSTSKQISELKEENYRKGLNQYQEGVLSADLLLTAFNDMTNAKINMISASASLKQAESRIKLNNTIR
ncbi:MAG: TolC family protein [Bacteroidia bacterium]